jgi:hypothetical protein
MCTSLNRSGCPAWRVPDNGVMPQRSMNGDRELSGNAARAAEAAEAAEGKNLGRLVESLPLQKRGLFKFRDTGHLVHRFEQGFVDDPPAGAAPLAAMRYDQISWVRQSYLKHYVNHYYNRTAFRFAIGSLANEVIHWEGSFFDLEEGSRLSFSKGDPRLPQFAAELAGKVSEARLPAHLKALADGKPLTFGLVVISQQGAGEHGGVVVPWSQLEPLEFDRGVAVVRRAGQRKPIATTHIGSIPNLPLFRTLYENLRRTRPT